MDRINYRFSLDCQRTGGQRFIQGLVNGESLSRRCVITLTSNGEAVTLADNGLTATMNAHGTSHPCTIADNKIIYEFQASDYAAVGETLYQVSVMTTTTPSRVLYTPSFYVEVSETDSATTGSATELTALQSALVQTQTAYETRLTDIDLDDDYTLTFTLANGTEYEFDELCSLLTDESARASAESGRVSAEASRVSAEASRVSAESSRASAEASRVSSENQRIDNETDRDSAESLRDSAEDSRASAETSRVNAESSRASAESSRVSAESSRVSAETGRVNAEAERVIHENARIRAEENRGTRLDTAEANITSLDARVDALESGGSGGTVPIATTSTAGKVKPDGESITVDADGTIHAVGGGGGGGTSNYNALSNRPQINSVTLSGNQTSSDLGLASSSHTHSYNDLSNRPSLSTVATSGSYNDLSNRPTIPTYTAGDGISITDGVIALNLPTAESRWY